MLLLRRYHFNATMHTLLCNVTQSCAPCSGRLEASIWSAIWIYTQTICLPWWWISRYKIWLGSTKDAYYWVWMAVINSHTGVMVVCLIMDQPMKALIRRHTLQSIIHRSNNETIFNPLFRRATMKQSNWVRALHCWRQNQGGIQMQQCPDLEQILLKIWATEVNADQNMGNKRLD